MWQRVISTVNIKTYRAFSWFFYHFYVEIQFCPLFCMLVSLGLSRHWKNVQ
jgi:hypothetical protein